MQIEIKYSSSAWGSLGITTERKERNEMEVYLSSRLNLKIKLTNSQNVTIKRNPNHYLVQFHSSGNCGADIEN